MTAEQTAKKILQRAKVEATLEDNFIEVPLPQGERILSSAMTAY